MDFPASKMALVIEIKILFFLIKLNKLLADSLSESNIYREIEYGNAHEVFGRL